MSNAADASPPQRSGLKRVLHLLRRLHLYLGLFLLPWAVLYGVTAFLFNHPTAMSDQPTASFSPAGTELENLPTPLELAEQVVAGLNARGDPATRVALMRPEQVRYGREFAFATVKTDGQFINILVDPIHGGGTIRARPDSDKKPTTPAPFAVGGKTKPAAPGKERPPPAPPPDGLRLSNPLHERMAKAIPTLLHRHGFASGPVTVTSVPDLVFFVEADGKIWKANYNALTGTVSGLLASEAEPPEELSARRYLTRLHVAHGYPDGGGPRWYWAMVVDLMATALLFWAATGLCMWWQVNKTRGPGVVVLVLSVASAAALGWSMFRALSPMP